MKYEKPALSIHDQIHELKNKGLIVNNEEKAFSYLSNISYYRLRAYTYPFQDNTNPKHPFIKKVSFEQIIDLYVFDRQFRIFVLDAIEKIEISMRTQISNTWAMRHGSHWYTNSKLYKNDRKFRNHYARLEQEVGRSNEAFITHYKERYCDPIEPPCWMSLEVSSFGLLSLLFSNLRLDLEKKTITQYYGLNKRAVHVLENWMHAFSNLRNICAHHGRLWNRRLATHIVLPDKPTFSFIQNTNILPYKIYSALCCMKYILNIISPKNTFTNRLKELMGTCPLAQTKEMGFPLNWDKDPFWN